jgi:hypothetical protein
MGPVTSPQATGTSGTVTAPGGWHPTVLYMLGLVLLEIVAVGFLSRHLLR